MMPSVPAPAGEAPPWRLEIAPKGYTVVRDVRDFTEIEALAVRDVLNFLAVGALGAPREETK